MYSCCFHKILHSRSKVDSFSKYGIVVGLICFILVFISNQTVQATPSDNVTIKMYRLDQNGGNTGILCSSNDTHYGCTAYVDNPSRAYPFSTSTITINMESHTVNNFEQGYLHNVTPHEVAITVSSQGKKPLAAVKAQAIASRSFASYYANLGTIINNTASNYQVYIPFTYKKLLPDQQQRIDKAVSDVLYMSMSNNSDVIRAHFGQDNGEWTNSTTGVSYLQSVYDPISELYGDENAGTTYGGMSSKGASRWGFGHTSSRGSVSETHALYPHDNQGYGDFWSVRWNNAFQILTHYYTDIHIRDASGGIMTPANRWNPLKVNWGSGIDPSNMPIGMTYQPQILIQNTSVSAWDSSIKLGCELTKANGDEYDCADVTMGVVAPGATVTRTLSIPIPAGSPKGVYNLKIDLKNASGWFREQAIPWHSLNYKLCVGSDSCSENYLPLVMKNYVPGCEPYSGYWYPTGNNECSPTSTQNCSRGAGLPDDGLYAGPILLNSTYPNSFHQVEFSPQLIQENTEIAVHWRSEPGVTGYGNMYFDAKIDGEWISLGTSSNQSAGDWTWWLPDDSDIGSYEGQYISGARFGMTRYFFVNHSFLVDSYRIGNFRYCGE